MYIYLCFFLSSRVLIYLPPLPPPRASRSWPGRRSPGTFWSPREPRSEGRGWQRPSSGPGRGKKKLIYNENYKGNGGVHHLIFPYPFQQRERGFQRPLRPAEGEAETEVGDLKQFNSLYLFICIFCVKSPGVPKGPWAFPWPVQSAPARPESRCQRRQVWRWKKININMENAKRTLLSHTLLHSRLWYIGMCTEEDRSTIYKEEEES